ncbi:DUF3606 domain-containing protein [Pelagibacterium luteolum]|uniref:DUF3606 domain-containing protein n=1 Tax=Pelagibacterium luteolum TaxID=440168 RepID=A0A1G7YYA7_9HYPH|nr:DUF3606 domain-containing protein [Pelagibacterium luteolum]SDH01279.1 Protein of unknown function [Pelagibacterium luteolum]
MPDDPSKTGYRDRDRVAGDQDYEVRYFAQQNGVTEQQTRDLIKKHGNMRTDLEREAKKLKS